MDSASIWDTATGKLSGTPLRHKSITHHGTQLAWQALRLGGDDEGTASYAAFALSLASGEAAAGGLLLQRVKDHPENPDTWDNAAAWLKRERAWGLAWLGFHRAAQGLPTKGRPRWSSL